MLGFTPLGILLRRTSVGGRVSWQAIVALLFLCLISQVSLAQDISWQRSVVASHFNPVNAASIRLVSLTGDSVLLSTTNGEPGRSWLEIYKTMDGSIWQSVSVPDTLDILYATQLSGVGSSALLQLRTYDYYRLPSLLNVDLDGNWNVVNWTPRFGRFSYYPWNNYRGIIIEEGVDDAIRRNVPFAGITHDGGRTFADTLATDTLSKFFHTYLGPVKQEWIDSIHGVIVCRTVGTTSPILRTANGGTSWSSAWIYDDNAKRTTFAGEVSSCKSSSLFYLQPYDSAHSFYYISSDGGNIWVQRDASNSGIELRMLSILSSTEYWAIGRPLGSHLSYSWIVRSTNAGDNWQIDSISARDLNCLHIKMDTNGRGWIDAIPTQSTDSSLIVLYRKPLDKVRGNFTSTTKEIISFPNPAHDYVTLRLPAEYLNYQVQANLAISVKVFDELGRACSTRNKIQGNLLTITLRDFRPGIYSVVITSSENFAHRAVKVVLQ